MIDRTHSQPKSSGSTMFQRHCNPVTRVSDRWRSNALVSAWATVAVLVLPVTANATAPDPDTFDKIAKLSVPFVPNAGQWDSRAAFAAQTFAGTLFVTKQGELVYSLPGKPIAGGERSDPTVGAACREHPSHSDHRTQAESILGKPLLQRDVHCNERTPGWVLSETLVDSKGRVRPMSQSTLKAPAGHRPMDGKVSFGIGSDTSKHADNLPTYERVNLGDVYPGINVQLRATRNNVEKIFTVAPEHDPQQIQIKLAGANKLEIGDQGELIAHTGNGAVTFTAPIAFQESSSGTRIPVQVAYALVGTSLTALSVSRNNITTPASNLNSSPTNAHLEASLDGLLRRDGQRYGFALGHYDPSLPLVIDPLLQSTYMGGAGFDRATALAIHPASGEVYVAGFTTSADLPAVDPVSGGVATGAQSGKSSGADAFVTRFNAALTQRLQSTYLGGAGLDAAQAIAIHPASGDVYIVGFTDSIDLPGVTAASGGDATGAQHVKSLDYDAFIARFNATLTQRLQSSYFGGNGRDYGEALAIHPASGEIYVTGSTKSTDLPSVTTASGGLSNGAQVIKSSGDDAFVVRFNATLTETAQSTYLGGLGTDGANAITIHPVSGEIYIAGVTGSLSLPSMTVASGGLGTGAQSVKSGGFDAFISRLNVSLTQCLQSTYFGGTRGAEAAAIAIHPLTGDVYIAGSTASSDLPSTTITSGGLANGAQPNSASLEDAFVARFNAALTQRPQSTYLGGSGYDTVNALAIHPSSGEVYVAGTARSLDFPATTAAAGAAAAAGFQTGNSGGYEAFVTRINSTLTRFGQSTYLGSSGDDNALALAIHPTTGEVYVAGDTDATLANFPGGAGGAQGAAGGGGDAFVSRFSSDLAAVAPICSLDSDGGGGAPDAATDGVILLRAMFGYGDLAVTDGALTGTPPRSTWPSIRHYLNNSCGTNFAPVIRPTFVTTACDLDLDGSGGAPNATSDGLMLVRAMLGLTGTAVTNGAISGTPPTNTWALIRDYLNQNCGTSFAP